MWMIPRLPPRDPAVVCEPMVRRRVRSAPCTEVFLTKMIRRRVSLSVVNGGASVWMKKASA
ncbi:hypothetical protein A2U01_0036187 [Trifolium medium]|uniref:Uncharacterized protein n=1 Tax=Trifolium medium TaxID=97028 RepID=A0A392PTP1_9FABA|nr:hypothetical protein [Trifolium medium]